ncbi:MAG TPA: HAD-IIB family hydrolase [Nitrospira sp.]|nr:HAD-IIB family hydrolase [Nitrospira sp.]
MLRMIIFTDLDGTLLDAASYSYHEAQEALALLHERDVPLILTSSKTRAEIEPLRYDLNNQHPFIVENGGAVFVPKGYFPVPLNGSVLRGAYQVTEFGASYPILRAALMDLAREGGLQLRGFGDMSAQEVAERTGLTVAAAALAKQREYDEPLVIEGLSEHIEQLDNLLRMRGLRLTRAGRFHHLSGATDKGRACRYLAEAYRQVAEQKGNQVITVGIGDSWNDLPMLAEVDRPILVQKPDGSYDPAVSVPQLQLAAAPGPRGWNRAVLELLSTH